MTKYGDKIRWKHPLNRCYTSMVVRCENPNSNRYHRYGARGIKVCDRWRERGSGFWNFVEDMGERPESYTLERIDNNADYTPENCRWASYREQAMNRSTNRSFTYSGKTQSLGEWASELGFTRTLLTTRFYTYGWTIEETLTTPVGKRRIVN